MGLRGPEKARGKMNRKEIFETVENAIIEQMKVASEARKRGDITAEEGKEIFRILSNAMMEVSA